MIMLHTDYRGFKDVMRMTSKSKPFAVEQEERKSSWGMVYEKKNQILKLPYSVLLKPLTICLTP